jgi:hypothetical protein
VTTTVERRRRGEVEDKREVNDKIPQSETIVNPAYVMVKGGVTLNLGDYNSARIDVSVTIPCVFTNKEMDRAFEYAASFVDEKIKSERAQLED